MTTASSSPPGAMDLPPEGGGAPAICSLDDDRARDSSLTGAKAAVLARAAMAGYPVLHGFVITTAATAAVDRAGGDVRTLPAVVRTAWDRLSDGGRHSLVVRSSSTAEDLADSSMAGRFESVVGVAGWDAFLDAVATVLASRTRAAAGDPRLTVEQPIAVLVQRLLDAELGGVLFGVDPVSGRSDRMVVAVAGGAPSALVSGEVDGDRYELDARGRVLRHVPGRGGATLPSRDRRSLVSLGARAEATFGGPQDIEWAVDRDGVLWLLQSRPVTTEVAGVPAGPLLGPGPVAETFPEPLARLEEALWVPPLRRALRTVFELVGTASPAELDASPLVTAVDGRAAVDLELFGEVPRATGRWSAFDPRPRMRRLRASWRVGRLRAALPVLADDLIATTDAMLAEVPPLGQLSDRQLLAVLDRVGEALEGVHGHEVLLGLLVSRSAPRFTGVAVALRILVNARAAGVPEEDITILHPVVLALVPPHVSASPPLPAVELATDWAPVPKGDAAALLREALRLRARWLQELSARAAWALGERLAERGTIGTPADARDLSLEDLRALVTGRSALWRLGAPRPADLPPLPARFRLTASGRPVAVHSTENPHPGSGAGGGRGRGVVYSGKGTPPHGSVLVVRTLDPSIAPLLPRLAGLVSETGSVLAHLAILSREAHVPTVVGVDDALERFPAGTVVTVDGTTGEITIEEQP